MSLSKSSALPLKIGNSHVWHLDSNSFIVNYCVPYRLVVLLGKYTHSSCETSNLHSPTAVASAMRSSFDICCERGNHQCLHVHTVKACVLLDGIQSLDKQE